jgi:hypothetical protein
VDRIIVAFANPEAQNQIQRLLQSQGIAPAGCFSTGAEVIRLVRKLGTASVVCGFKLRDMTAANLAENLLGLAPVLVVSTAARLSFCEGENLFKLAFPASRADFFSSLSLLCQIEEQQLRPPVMRKKVSEQKLVTQAKELLMDICQMSEAEAHRFLQKRSMDTGMRLVETAQLVIDTYAP